MAKRLIDLDEALKQLRDYADRKNLNGHNDTANGILNAVCYIRNNMTIVDAVEVVRCRYCKHHRTFHGRDMCAKNAKVLDGHEVGLHATGANDFCSYGKRRSE